VYDYGFYRVPCDGRANQLDQAAEYQLVEPNDVQQIDSPQIGWQPNAAIDLTESHEQFEREAKLHAPFCFIF
jgi:hypothetical protein